MLKAKAVAAAVDNDVIDDDADEPGPPVAEAVPVLPDQPLDAAPQPLYIPPARQSYAMPPPFVPPPPPPQVVRKLKKDGGEKATRRVQKAQEVYAGL